jgi:hypothetical protein
MGEIEKRHNLESQNLDIGKIIFFSSMEKSHIILLKISQFWMKKFEINELIKCDTFFQQSVCGMSLFDIIKSKNLI